MSSTPRILLTLLMMLTVFTSACAQASTPVEHPPVQATNSLPPKTMQTPTAIPPKNTQAPTPESFGIVATFTPPSKTAFEYNPPTIVDGFIYIGTSTKIALDGDMTGVIEKLPDNSFYKMDTDLNVLWEYPLGKTQVDGGAVLDSQGNIYFVTITYKAGISTDRNKPWPVTQLELVSLDSAGVLRWKQPITDDWVDWQHAMTTPAISVDDVIYTVGSRLFAFKPDGSLLWKFPTGAEIFSNLRTAPIIDQSGALYLVAPQPTNNPFGSDNIIAYKFTPDSNGKPVWATTLDNQVLDNEGPSNSGGGNYGGGQPERWMYSSPAFSQAEASLYIAVGNTINRVNTASGEILWSLKPEGATGSFKASPVVDDQDNLFIGTKSNTEGTLFAIRADGTGLLWKEVIGADLYSTPLLGDDGMIYFGSEQTKNGTYHVLDRMTGKTPEFAFKVATPDLSFGAPALYKGYIYMGVFEFHEGNASLYKLRVPAQGYLSDSPWPRFHGGNLNTGRTEK